MSFTSSTLSLPQVQLEKAVPCWWERLLQAEPAVDLAAMDRSKPLAELASEEQMKIQELQWMDWQKRVAREARGHSEPGIPRACARASAADTVPP